MFSNSFVSLASGSADAVVSSEMAAFFWPAERRSGSRRISPRRSHAGPITKRERAVELALTRDFKATVKDRAAKDAAFRAALLTDAVELLLSGDVETGKSVLRDFINATIGFERLAELVDTPPKSLMRMFGPKGNPRADNLFDVISKLQEETGVHLAVAAA